MDTKLKNKCRFRRLLVALSVIMCAVIMICLYPYFGKKAMERNGEYYETSGFLSTIPEINYVTYFEGKNQAEKERISPEQLYMPELSSSTAFGIASAINGMEADEYGMVADAIESDNDKSDFLREVFYNQYEDWERLSGQYRTQVDYQLVDDTANEVLATNLRKDASWNDAAYSFLMKIKYDANGDAEITQMNGIREESALQNLEQQLQTNPMENYYEGQMKYEGRYAFHKPVNCTFYYGMSEAQITAMQYDNYGQRGEYAYFMSGEVQTMHLSLAAFMAVMALLIPCLNLGFNGKSRLYSAYCEAVVIIGFFLVGSSMHVTMVASHNSGAMQKVLVETGLLPAAASVLDNVCNFLWWSVNYLLIFWVVSCLRMIYVMGVRHYIRERCYLYRIGMYIRSLARALIQWIYRIIEDIERSRESNRTIFKIVIINFLILSGITILWAAGIIALVIYSIVLYRILTKYYRDRSEKYRILLEATNEIANGNLDVNIEEDLGMFEPFKVEIQKIQHGFKKAVDEEVKSQRMKTDLISNVSHDLKTPLTAIITYVDLLKNESITPEERRAYVDVLDKKSTRLKILIEDIFEISKATSQNVTLNLVEMDIVNLLKQVRLELGDKIEGSGLDFRWNLPETKVVLTLDSQKTYRIFENLLLNIVKYSLPGTRAYVDMAVEGGQVVIRMKNISAVELNINPEDMTERFARGDQARNTEGSGLGLAIVKSFVELQKGKLELETEADLFKVTIRWNLDKR